jgi:hypothetical protein
MERDKFRSSAAPFGAQIANEALQLLNCRLE